MNFLMDRSEENKKKYSKQQNYCLSLLRKSKSEYFGNLKKKSAIGLLWVTIIPRKS